MLFLPHAIGEVARREVVRREVVSRCLLPSTPQSVTFLKAARRRHSSRPSSKKIIIMPLEPKKRITPLRPVLKCATRSPIINCIVGVSIRGVEWSLASLVTCQNQQGQHRARNVQRGHVKKEGKTKNVSYVDETAVQVKTLSGVLTTTTTTTTTY